MKITPKFWIGLCLLVVVSPLGVLLPRYFKAGCAWGEWGVGGIQNLTGYVPEGLEKISHLWSAPLHNYVFKGGENGSIASLCLAYIVSAVAGVLICIGIILILGKFLSKK